ncbi:Oxidoreductase [Gnomoniopsis smithogilvyi]|uniref:Mitochondrial intermembrane space import and assembly protein 40 n=1 Tax=Gnomoniopsis smithogilvyi TaxID=1191159 RepID=A0A9W9CX31_9PEZI|nr:Oxidoreductase [Gnomoniopsis smithogilvyi]
MFRAAARTGPRALRQSSVASFTGRRFASTAPADKRYTWKGTAARWGAAIGALYWYNTSPIFADELPSRMSTEPPHFAESDLTTVDAIVEEKRKTLDARLKAKEEQAAKEKTPQSPPPQKDGSAAAAAVATPEDAEKSPEQLEEEAGQQGAFNPETGEINWDCPCLGGMAHGPCGEEFKSAFSCFVYSTEEPKGMDCVDKFQHMQDCFRKYPEVYGEEIADEEAAEAEAEAAAANAAAPVADVKDATSKATAPETSAKPAPATETPAKSEEKKSIVAPSPEQKAHDATADAPKSAAPAPATQAPAHGDSQAFKDDLVDGQRAIPKRSFDATSANVPESR